MPASCRFLEWDTEFFGVRTARVNERCIDAGEFEAVLGWCEKQRIGCLYLLADASDAKTCRGAEDNGFHLADIRVTFGTSVEKALKIQIEDKDFASTSIRPVKESDVAALVEIARVSHTDSRFYFDPGFARERCDALYGVWIEKSCQGDAQAVFVADRDGTPEGYITCHIDGDTGSIGLIGVAARARGAGLGGQLVKKSLSYFSEHGLNRAAVVTQGRNATAQRMYERSGFLVSSVELWYHRWFAEGRDQGR